MSGNIDLEGTILDLLVDTYGHSQAYNSKHCCVDYSVIYSNGFIYAVEEGKIPELEIFETCDTRKKRKEYHHLIINDECFICFFD